MRIALWIEDAELGVFVVARSGEAFPFDADHRRGRLGETFLSVSGVVVSSGDAPQTVFPLHDTERTNLGRLRVVAGDLQRLRRVSVFEVGIEDLTDTGDGGGLLGCRWSRKTGGHHGDDGHGNKGESTLEFVHDDASAGGVRFPASSTWPRRD